MAQPAPQGAEHSAAAGAETRPGISVVVPVKDEQDNILPLIEEIDAALAAFPDHEIVYVDDGSTDGTGAALLQAKVRFPQLRCLRHDRSCGQSRAIRTGVQHARGTLVITLDGDGQNDPADMPALIALYNLGSPDRRVLGMVAGQRAKRRDSWVKRRSSRIANGLRRRLLDDDCVDTGCGLKLITRECFLALPYFDHLHRFLPALVKREGYAVRFVDVNHRPRQRGRSKYGTMNRLWVGIADLRGVMWLNRRSRRPNRIEEL
ncbi:MAG: glycosyltransferase family 2 protein [Alphaproteobacteria bacterium]